MNFADKGPGILDTSTVILLPRILDPNALPSEPMITAITLAELSVGPLVTSTQTERAYRQAHLDQAATDFEALPFNKAAARSLPTWPTISAKLDGKP